MGAGFILGGLMSGVGKGLEMNAVQAREDALERLRAQRQVDAEGRAETNLIEREGRAEQRDVRKDEREYGTKTGLLALASQYKRAEGETEQAWKERLERIRGEETRKTEAFKGGIDKDLAAFRSQLDIKKDAASQRLAAEIDSGEVQSIEQAADGELIKFMRNGTTVRSGVKGAPKEKSAAAIEAETEARRQHERDNDKRVKRGEKPLPFPGDEPQKSAAAPSNPKPNSSWYTGGETMKPGELRIGAIEDGYKYLGGDRADPKNWQKVR